MEKSIYQRTYLILLSQKVRSEHIFRFLLKNSILPQQLNLPIIDIKNWINTTGVTSGAGTAYPSEAPEFTTSF
jgi:hypothetical protein